MLINYDVVDPWLIEIMDWNDLEDLDESRLSPEAREARNERLARLYLWS